MPSSRCTSRSARRRISARSDGRHADQLGDHVHGQQPGEVGDEVERARLERGVQVGRRRASRIRSSMAATRRGVKLLPTMERMRVCRGGSMARNDMARCASGPRRPGRGDARRRWSSGRRRGTPPARRRGARGEEVELLVVEDRGLGAQAGVGRVRVLVDPVVVRAVATGASVVTERRSP